MLTLGAVAVGATQAGFAGALTGLVSVLTVGGSSLNALGYSRDGIGTTDDARGRAERLSALLSGGGALAAVIYGGWRLGWAWGIAGYVIGMTVGMGATAKWHRWGKAASTAPVEPLTGEDVTRAVNRRLAIHDAYCDFLADKPPSLFTAALLPAPIEEIKGALIFTALKRQMEGTLTPELLRHTKQAFGSLARCVADERAQAAATLDQTVDAYHASLKGDEDVMVAAQALRAALAADATEPREADVAALWREFDERWGRAQRELHA